MIKIRPHKKTDVPFRVAWLNNPKANKFIGDMSGRKTTLRKQRQWFDDYLKDKHKKFFTICDNKTPVGFMGLTKIDKVKRNADLFIVIGEDKYRGRGFGELAILYLINYGFNKLKLHKIYLGVYEENKQALKLYKKLGFTTEGVLKDEAIAGGKFHNLLFMAIFNKGDK